ncbi:unnamed protein product, partial [Meganyctiphanes norvegica]
MSLNRLQYASIYIKYMGLIQSGGGVVHFRQTTPLMNLSYISKTKNFKARARPFLPVVYVFLILVMVSLNRGPLGLAKEEEHQIQKRETELVAEILSTEVKDSSSIPDVVFFLILCQGTAGNNQGGKSAADFSRQLRQTAVMFKSAVTQTKTTLRFIIIADSEELYHRTTNLTYGWPEEYTNRLKFEYHPVWYPEDRQAMRSMFRVCATQRLFLPDMFPDLDAAIYIDTDLVFMRPPEDLWAEFNKFNKKQSIAMAPCDYHYDSKRNKVPYYGKTGLNAGIMHMNLTRMKSFPWGGWTPANMKVYDQYKKKIKLADQDILNILFNKLPQHLYELGCEWNYRIWQCSQGRNLCNGAEERGVSILHGNAMAFVNGTEMKIQVIFEAFEQFKLGTPLNTLLDTIDANLKKVSVFKSKCAKISNIDEIFTTELRKQVM